MRASHKKGSGRPGPRAGVGPNRRRLPPRCWLAYFLEACQRAPAAWPVACAVARSSRRDNNSAVRSGDRQTPTPPPRHFRAPHAAAGGAGAALRLSGTGGWHRCARRCGPCRLGCPSGLTAWDERTGQCSSEFRGSCPAPAPAVL
jgi:hypothetical protein